MRLVITEKPSVAATIAKVLGAGKRGEGCFTGNGYIVSFCFGHLAAFSSPECCGEAYAKWEKETLPILPDEWQYSIPADKQKQFDILKGLMNDSGTADVINACDAGREGELIFRTVYLLAGCTKPVFRLWISSMEDSAIKKGFDELRPGKEYDTLYAAALCRSKADWLVGINATRLFSVANNTEINNTDCGLPFDILIFDQIKESSNRKSVIPILRIPLSSYQRLRMS